MGWLNYWLSTLTAEQVWTNIVVGFTGSTEFNNRISNGRGSTYDGEDR